MTGPFDPLTRTESRSADASFALSIGASSGTNIVYTSSGSLRLASGFAASSAASLSESDARRKPKGMSSPICSMR